MGLRTSLNVEQLGERTLPAAGGFWSHLPANLSPVIQADIAELRENQLELKQLRVDLAPAIREDKIALARAIQTGNASAIEAARRELANTQAPILALQAEIQANIAKLLADLKAGL